jgi:lysophospholipase L1-like esterase
LVGSNTVPTVTAANHLRRFVAQREEALFTRVPIVCVGDSITYGQGADGVNGVGSNPTDAAQGWVGQLRAMFAKEFGSDPGEGFFFADESRVTTTGVGAGAAAYSAPLRHARRLASGLTWAVQAPAAGFLTVIQANNAGDVTGAYTITPNGGSAGASTPLPAITGTGVSIATDIAVSALDTVTVSGPASGLTYIVGGRFKSAATTGMEVHRVGQGGYVSGDALGGQTNGVLNLPAPSAAIGATAATINLPISGQTITLAAAIPASVGIYPLQVNIGGHVFTCTGTSGSNLLGASCADSGSIAAGTAVYSLQQTQAIRKLYDWAGGPGLLIVSFGGNDQNFQPGGNAGGSSAQNGVTLALYTAWMQQIVSQAVADGWAVLISYNPVGYGLPTIAGGMDSDYRAAAKSIAAQTDHCAYVGHDEVFGSNAQGIALGLQYASSVHPKRIGYGVMARAIKHVLDRVTPLF